MKRCIQCGRNLPDNAQSCPYCGTQQNAMMRPVPAQQRQDNAGSFCPYCGRRLERGSRFCAGCGATVNGGPDYGARSASGTSSDVLKIICLIAALLYQRTAVSAIGYFTYYFMADKIWGLFMFVAAEWSVLILAMIGLKCGRRYGKNMICALMGGAILKVIMHIIRLVRTSGMFYYYVTNMVSDILGIILTIAATGVICYLMQRDGILDFNNGETLGQTIQGIPQALKQMLDLNLNKGSTGSYPGGRRAGFNEATPGGRLRTMFASELFFIFVCVYSLKLIFNINSGFVWLNVGPNLFPLLTCCGLLLIFYSNNWKDRIDDGGFFLINLTLSFKFYLGIAGAVITGIILLIVTVIAGAYMLIVDLLVAVYLFLGIFYWWTLKRTVESARGVIRGTEHTVYTSVYPVVILVIQAVYKVGMFIWACIMQIVANSLIYTVDQYGNSATDFINEILREAGLGYGDVSGLTQQIIAPINSWIQNIFGFSQNPLIMLIGIAVPIFEIMLLLKLRSYRNA